MRGGKLISFHHLRSAWHRLWPSPLVFAPFAFLNQMSSQWDPEPLRAGDQMEELEPSTSCRKPSCLRSPSRLAAPPSTAWTSTETWSMTPTSVPDHWPEDSQPAAVTLAAQSSKEPLPTRSLLVSCHGELLLAEASAPRQESSNASALSTIGSRPTPESQHKLAVRAFYK